MRLCPKCNAQYSSDQAICPIDATTLVDSSGKTAQVADPMIGRMIADKYRVEKLLGRGGMGAVYEGQHLLLDRRVAIKVLQQNMANDEQAASRFIREAKASARIEHPNAVTIYDFGVLQEGSAYLVMEFIKGRSLRQVLIDRVPVRPDQIIDWMIQVCNVVEVAHTQGIIHRDLKPENVMLKESTDGSLMVKVVDFGLAKITSDSGEKASVNLTKPGEVLGTPHYMAPEYYEGEIIDKRADVYAIGIMIYEMFCGDTPFTGTVQSIIGGHLFKDPLPIIKSNPSIHPVLDAVVQKALKKKRDERIASAGLLAQELKDAMHVAKEFFFQKTEVNLDPLTSTETLAKTQSNLDSSPIIDRNTVFQTETEQILKTEKVLSPGTRETTKVSRDEIIVNSRATQQMTLGTMAVPQEAIEANIKNPLANIQKEEHFIDSAKITPSLPALMPTNEPSFTSAPTKIQTPSQSINTGDNEVRKPSLSFTSAPTRPQLDQTPVVAAEETILNTEIVPPTRISPAINPNSAAIAPVSRTAATSVPSALASNIEYESFMDVLIALKTQLVIGSIIVFLLAVMVTLLIVYYFERM
ncbi:MAG: protein kinase [Blastocatellia bacterium]